MAQLSRPYQLGLLAVVLLAAAWLLLLQGHSTTPSAPSSSSSPAQTVTSRVAKSSATASHGSSGASSHIYHGAAPGVEGLTKDIAKARGAVETSKQNARQLAQKSAQASDESTHAAASKPTVSTAATTTAATKSAASKAAASKAAANTTAASTTAASRAAAPAKASAPTTSAKPSAAAATGVPSAQRSVEAQLAKGKIVLILFWNPKGADDTAVHQALAQLQRKAGLGIAVHEASAEQVASFGTITKGVQVYGTPTLLILNKQGRALTLTGLQDAFTIEQAIQEAKQP